LPSTQPLNVISLIWQHFSASECHIQASSCTIALSYELKFEKNTRCSVKSVLFKIKV